MKHFYSLVAALCLCAMGNAQVVFQSDLSSWSMGLPTDFFGTRTSAQPDSVSQIMTSTPPLRRTMTRKRHVWLLTTQQVRAYVTIAPV